MTNKTKFSFDRERGTITLYENDEIVRNYGFKHPTRGWVDDWKEVYEKRLQEFLNDDRFVVEDKQ